MTPYRLLGFWNWSQHSLFRKLAEVSLFWRATALHWSTLQLLNTIYCTNNHKRWKTCKQKNNARATREFPQIRCVQHKFYMVLSRLKQASSSGRSMLHLLWLAFPHLIQDCMILAFRNMLLRKLNHFHVLANCAVATFGATTWQQLWLILQCAVGDEYQIKLQLHETQRQSSIQ